MNCSRKVPSSVASTSADWLVSRRSSSSICAAMSSANSSSVGSALASRSAAGFRSRAQIVPKTSPERFTIGTAT